MYSNFNTKLTIRFSLLTNETLGTSQDFSAEQNAYFVKQR